jgi:hypothetical protein
VLYTDINSLSNVFGLASDDDHEVVFWTNYKDGATFGGVNEASYNGKVGTLRRLNSLPVVTAIDFEDDQLYFIANGTDVYTQNLDEGADDHQDSSK